MERFSGATRTCPSCKSEVYDDAEMCHECGHAFAGGTKQSPWVFPAMIAIVASFVLGYLVWIIF